ncbi:MAG: DUF3179 domain-containing protein [Bacteroidetes bacterium]|nr:DUF3179 domain-containing protein [Bacteroidota bacterium]MCH7769580.1 DUF3179 domain-containing protein [Bacteroidota bacterium]
MKVIKIISLITLAFYLSSCDTVDNADVSGDWLIPKDEVFDGGPGRDGIPSVDNPQFTDVEGSSYLLDNDLVIGIKIGGVLRAYPHPILDWHEIVNDEINGKKLAITYCPLTGSAIAWNRQGVVSNSTFGVSGLLYNSNLIPFDRGSKSNWSQMKLQCVNGQLIGNEIETSKIIETTYKTWREMYPTSKLLSTNTGFGRQYGVYPYNNFKTSNDLIFPVSNEDNRLHKKERVLGLIAGGQTMAFVINSFSADVSVKNVSFGGEEFVVIGSSGKNFAAAYKRKLNDGTTLEFTITQGELPLVMMDNEGTKWDIFGEAIEGPRAGENLMQAKAFIAYWFGWAAFYPNTLISQ